MAGLFLSQEGMRETKHSETVMNSYRKREKLEHHPLRGAYKCGCSADCGAFYTINRDVDMREIKLTKPKKATEYDECHHFRSY